MSQKNTNQYETKADNIQLRFWAFQTSEIAEGVKALALSSVPWTHLRVEGENQLCQLSSCFHTHSTTTMRTRTHTHCSNEKMAFLSDSSVYIWGFMNVLISVYNLPVSLVIGGAYCYWGVSLPFWIFNTDMCVVYFQSSSIDFLASQGFDFNKVFCSGKTDFLVDKTLKSFRSKSHFTWESPFFKSLFILSTYSSSCRFYVYIFIYLYIYL